MVQRALLILLVLALGSSVCWLVCRNRGDDAPAGQQTTKGESGAPSADRARSGDDRERVATGTPEAADTGMAESPAADDPTPTPCEVRVVDEADAPVPDREVWIVDPTGDDRLALRTTTDGQGVADFLVPVAGTRRLVALLAGGPEHGFLLTAGEPRRISLTLVPAVVCAGRVVDAAGNGVANATLWFLPMHSVDLPELPRVAQVGSSRRDGSFRVVLPSEGHLGADHPQYVPSAMTRVTPRRDASGPLTVTVRLALLGSPLRTEGIVVDAADAPVPGAVVELRVGERGYSGGALPAPPIRLRTDRDGRFVTDDLRPGPVHYEATAPGVGCARGVVPASAIGLEVLRLRLQPAAEVYGTVSDAGGGAAPPVVIRFGEPGDLLSRYAECVTDGSYRLREVPSGDVELVAYEMRARADGQARRRVAATLSLSPGERVDWSPSLPEHRGAELLGVVVDARGEPLAGWTILAGQSGERAHRLSTDAVGRFALPVKGAAPCDVLVYAPGSPPDSFAAACVRDVAPNGQPLRIEVDPIAANAVVRGQVESIAREQLPAKILCFHQGREQTVQTVAASDGAFHIDGVPAGAIVLFFSFPGFLESSFDAVVDAGENLDVGVVTLAVGVAVHGTVTTHGGPPPDQLLVSIQTEGQRFLAEVAAGSYRFEAVPPGRHRLLVQGEGIAAAAHEIEVRAGVDLRQDIVVAPGLPRRLRVVGAAAGANWITLALRRTGEQYTWIAGQPRGDSVEFVAYMSPGTYDAFCWDDSGRRSRARVTFAVGAVAPVSLTLE